MLDRMETRFLERTFSLKTHENPSFEDDLIISDLNDTTQGFV